MISLNTNILSQLVQRNMKDSTNQVNLALERLSTGFRINHAKDDAAGYSIANLMDSKLSSYQVAEENVSMGLDLVGTAEELLSQINNRMVRLRALQEQAANGTYSADSLNAINAECNAILDEISRIYSNGEYNGLGLFQQTVTAPDGSQVIQQNSYATRSTTLKELSIGDTTLNICDGSGSVIDTINVYESDNLGYVFDSLQAYGFTSSISNGRISIKSSNDCYVAGDLADELGITTTSQEKVTSTTSNFNTTQEVVTQSTTLITETTTTTTSTTQTQSTTTVKTVGTTDESASSVTFSEQGLATSTTELGKLIDFEGGAKTVNVLNSSGTSVATKDFSSTDTVQTLLDFCSTNGITASITDGVISFNSTNNNYLQDGSTNGVLGQLGVTSTSGTVSKTIGKAVKGSYISEPQASLTESVWSSKFSGYIYYDIYIYCPDGTRAEIDLASCTLAEFKSFMSGFGITTGYSNGVLKVTAMTTPGYEYKNSYEMDGWESSYAGTKEIKVGSNAVFDETFKKVASTSTKLSAIGASGTTYITVVQDGTEKTVTLSASNTIAQVISKLGSVGITATLSSGYFSVAASTTSYIKGMTDSLATALKVSGKTWSTTTTTTTTTLTPSAEQNYSYTSSLSGGSTLADLGINSNLTITVVQDGTEKQVAFNTTDTLDTFITNLAGAGITASVADGKFSLSGSNTAYISYMPDTLKTALNLSGNFSTETTSVTTTSTTIYTTTTTTTTRTETLTETNTVAATGSTTFGALGLTSSMNVTVARDGTKSTINVGKNTTLDDFYTALAGKGITATTSGGVVTLAGNGNSYIDSANISDLLGISAVSKNTTTKTVNNPSSQLGYTKTITGVATVGTLGLQVGINADEGSRIEVDVAFNFEGLDELRNIGLDGNNYLEQIDEMIRKLSVRQTEYGAAQNRLESVLDSIQTNIETLTSSLASTRDADIAKESTRYLQQQILQNACATLLSTANQTPSVALALINGSRL